MMQGPNSTAPNAN